MNIIVVFFINLFWTIYLLCNVKRPVTLNKKTERLTFFFLFTRYVKGLFLENMFIKLSRDGTNNGPSYSGVECCQRSSFSRWLQCLWTSKNPLTNPTQNISQCTPYYECYTLTLCWFYNTHSFFLFSFALH